MQEAQKAGLSSWDMAAVNATYQSLGSATADLGWQERLTQAGMSEQALALGKIQIKQGEQNIELGEFMKEDREYIRGRRGWENSIKDRAALDEVITSAVANGDDKELDHLMNVLAGGGAVSPDLYQGLMSAGVTLETLEESYGDALNSNEWREKKHSLDMTEMKLAEDQLFRSTTLNELELASAQGAYADQVAHQMTPAEIKAALADPRSSLSQFRSSGVLSESTISNMKTNSRGYAIVRQAEVDAPKIDRAFKMMDLLSGVPADPTKAEDALLSQLGELEASGVINAEDKAGIVSLYKRGWTYDRATQDEELRSAQSSRLYTNALRKVSNRNLIDNASVEALPDWADVRDAYADDLDALTSRADLIGCGGEDASFNEGTKAECAAISQEMNLLQQERREVNTEFLGVLGPGGTAIAMTNAITAIETNVRNDPKLQGASELDVTRAINNRLQRQGLGSLPEAAFEEARALDEAGREPREPAAEQPRRGFLGTVRDTLWKMGPGGAALSPAEVQAAAGQPTRATPQPAQQAQPQQAVAISSTTGAGTLENLRSDPEFTTLVSAMSGIGNLVGVSQYRLVDALAKRTGLAGTAILEMARNELSGSMSNPIAAPTYRAPRGQ